MNELMKKMKAYEAAHGEPMTFTGHDDIEYKAVELKSLKKGQTFKRKFDAKMTLERNHYNRKDFFGPANYSCSDENYPWGGHEIFLKPTTTVFVEV